MAVSAQEAQRRYDDLDRSDWRAASLWGITLALEAYLQSALLRAFRRAVRRHAGVRTPRGKGMPDWVVPALVEAIHVARVTSLRVALLNVLLQPAFAELILELRRKESIEAWFAGLDGGQRLQFEQRVMPLLHVPHDARKAAEHAELVAFYRGVRMQFHVKGLGEPKPSELRWLAAARALEPVVGSVDAARVVWEDRVRRWRPKMDREWAGWREALAR